MSSMLARRVGSHFADCNTAGVVLTAAMVLLAFPAGMPSFTLKDKCISKDTDYSPAADAKGKATLVILLTSS